MSSLSLKRNFFQMLLGCIGFMTLSGVMANSPTTGKTILKVQESDSSVQWTGKKVGGKHWGNVPIKKGHLEYLGPELVGGEFILDMTGLTVSPKDVPDKNKNAKLTGHLKNDDFFAVDKFNDAKLVIKSATLGKGGAYNIMGDLTIKGKTRPIMFDAKINKKGKTVEADANIVFDRTQYGIKYKSKILGFETTAPDKIIYDDVQIKVAILAK